MRNNDMIRMALQNLLRRRSRTMLTILGVVVGCCSIIIMVSLGVGSKAMQEVMLADMGDLTIIQVSSSGKSAQSGKLDPAAIKKFAAFPGVIASTPKLTADMGVEVYAGSNRRYKSSYMTVVGMDPKALEKMGYQLLEGKYPVGKQAVIGQSTAYSFNDTLRPSGQDAINPWEFFGQEEQMPDPYFNPMKESIELSILMDDPKKKAPSITLEAAGRLKEDYAKGHETIDGIILPIDELEKLLAEYNRLNGKPTPVSRNYQLALVKVKNIQSVSGVEKQIQMLGFRTNSMESIRKPLEEEARQKQMMLGGLGAVSLIVAAIGITNTMIMSISERTREIGIMKSLGCYVGDIRASFLLEAGCIGFIGGITGIIISLLVSLCINIVSSTIPLDSLRALLMLLSGPRMSIVPVWLIGIGLVFSVLIGVCAGYYPANKAVLISSLEAMKQ